MTYASIGVLQLAVVPGVQACLLRPYPEQRWRPARSAQPGDGQAVLAMPGPALLRLLQRWLPAAPWPIASSYIAKWRNQDIIQLALQTLYARQLGEGPHGCSQQRARYCWILAAGTGEALTTLTDQSALCPGAAFQCCMRKTINIRTECLICIAITLVIYEESAHTSSQHTSGSAQAAQSPPRCHRHRRHLRQSPRCSPTHARCPRRGHDQMSLTPGSQAAAGWCCRPCTRLSDSAPAEQ